MKLKINGEDREVNLKNFGVCPSCLHRPYFGYCEGLEYFPGKTECHCCHCGFIPLIDQDLPKHKYYKKTRKGFITFTEESEHIKPEVKDDNPLKSFGVY